MANALTRFANYAAPKTGAGIISALRVSRTNIAFGPGNEVSAIHSTLLWVHSGVT